MKDNESNMLLLVHSFKLKNERRNNITIIYQIECMHLGKKTLF